MPLHHLLMKLILANLRVPQSSLLLPTYYVHGVYHLQLLLATPVVRLVQHMRQAFYLSNHVWLFSYYRGTATIELKKRFPALKGAMMAVGCSKEEITPLIAQLTAREVRIACFNSPDSLTISGDEPAIDQLQVMMEKKEMFNRKLQVDVAYHSHHMKLVAKSYLAYLQSLDLPKSTQIKFHSSLLGHLIDGSRLEPSYWVDNLTESVQFSEALTSMCQPIDGHKTGVNMIVEIGPHSALAGPVKQILKACGPKCNEDPLHICSY